jgi:hypothetical protein
MRRLPVRARVTLVFALALALVLAGTGLFLYLRFRSGFDYTLNQGLRSRAGDVTALVKQADTGRFYLLEQAWDYDYEPRHRLPAPPRRRLGGRRFAGTRDDRRMLVIGAGCRWGRRHRLSGCGHERRVLRVGVGWIIHRSPNFGRVAVGRPEVGRPVVGRLVTESPVKGRSGGASS